MNHQSTNNDSPQPTGRRTRWNSTSILGLVLAVGVVSFIAGTRSEQIYATVGPILGFNVESGQIDLGSTTDTYRTLSRHFDGKLDKQALIAGANKGLVEAAGDQYTVYMTADEAEKFQKDLSGDIGGGIGAEIGKRSGQPTIVRVLANHPAQEAGVQAGDVIVAINKQPAVDATVDEVVSKLRGEAGTSVNVTVLRGDKSYDFQITRRVVDHPSVESDMRGETGVLTVSRFDEQTGQLAREHATRLLDRGAKSIVLDLRSNGGGYVTAAQSVSGLWLDKKVIMAEKKDGKTVDELKSTGRPILANTPTVVLINGSSASASEIVAGALEEYKKAELVGETTYGKGSVQQVLKLSGGAQLKVTIARWYTPKGKSISETGVKPTREVKLTAENVNDNQDPQLEAALEVLKP